MCESFFYFNTCAESVFEVLLLLLTENCLRLVMLLLAPTLNDGYRLFEIQRYANNGEADNRVTGPAPADHALPAVHINEPSERIRQCPFKLAQPIAICLL